MKFNIFFQIIFSIIGYLFAGSLRHHPDPSYNPIRSDWVSGPRIDKPIEFSRKLKKHHKALITHHTYKETTRKLQRKALHK